MPILPQQTQDIIDKQIAAAPLAFQDAFTSFDWQADTAKVGSKYRLSPQQTVQLVAEVAMIMVGIANPAEFMDELQKQIGVSADIAKKMAEDVKTQVFDKMQSALLNQNRQHIEYLQNRVAQIEHEEGNASLQEAGIEITDEPGVVDMDATAGIKTSRTREDTDMNMNTDTSTQNPKYVGHDPYHEPIE